MSKEIFPHATPDLAATRKRLAPHTHDAFMAFSERVFAEGALPGKIKQLIAVAAAHITQVSVLHPWPHQSRAPARGDGRGGHGSNLGRCGDAGGGRLCPRGSCSRCDRRLEGRAWRLKPSMSRAESGRGTRIYTQRRPHLARGLITRLSPTNASETDRTGVRPAAKHLARSALLACRWTC